MSVSKDIEYIKRIKIYILVAVALFLVSAIYGAVITEKSQEGKDMAKDIVKNMPKSNTKLEVMIEVFKSNIYNSLLAVLLGIAFGVIPVYIAIINGIAIGSLIQYMNKMHGGFIFFLMILPHSIIEFPLMFISMGIGLRLGYVMCKSMIKDSLSLKDVRLELKQGLYFYVKWIIPLLFVAAFIEGYITPVIAKELVKLI